MTLVIAYNSGKDTFIATDGQTTKGLVAMELNHKKFIKGRDCYIGLVGQHDKLSQFLTVLRENKQALLDVGFSKDIDAQQPQLFKAMGRLSDGCKNSDVSLHSNIPSDAGLVDFVAVIRETIYDCRLSLNKNQNSCMENKLHLSGMGSDFARPLLGYLLDEQKMEPELAIKTTIDHVSRWCKGVGTTSEIVRIKHE